MPFYDFPADRKTDSTAAVFPLTVQALEQPKDPLGVLRIKPMPLSVT